MNIKKIPAKTFNNNPKGYIEILPSSYDGVKKFPILYWLHGLGETGNGSSTELDEVLNKTIANWLKTHDIEFIVLVPQDANGYWNSATLGIRAFIEWVNIQYAKVIDTYQQHIAGLSSGGYGLRDFLIGNSDVYKNFATLTFMSTNTNLANTKAQQIIDNKQHVWFHHGEIDPSPNALNSVAGFHKAIYALDPSRTRLTAYKGMGHTAWEEVFDASGRLKEQLTGTYKEAVLYNWTAQDMDWYEWMKVNAKVPDVVIPINQPESILNNYILNNELIVETIKGKYKVPVQPFE